MCLGCVREFYAAGQLRGMRAGRLCRDIVMGLFVSDISEDYDQPRSWRRND
jgi:hypothetical protein